MKRSSRWTSSAAALAVLTCIGGVALANRSGSDRNRAEAALAALARVPAHARLAHEPMVSARRALERANDAYAAGDARHAPELDALAREHAETGTDLVRAAEAEKKLRDVQKDLSEVETKLSRARALLEEALARRGRAQAKVDDLENPKVPPVSPPPDPKAAKKPPTKPGKGQP